MVPDADRVGPVALAALAVFLAAALLPAAGFGSVPSPTPSEASSDAGADPLVEFLGDLGDRPAPNADPPPEPPAGPSTPTPTPTPTPEDSTAAADPPDGDGGGPLALVAGTFLATISVVLLALEGKARNWPGLGWLPIPAVSVFSIPRAVSQGTVAFLVRVSTGVPRVLADLGAVTDAFTRGTGSALAGIGRTLADATAAVSRGLAAVVVAVPRGLVGVFAGASDSDATAPDPTPDQTDDAEAGTEDGPSPATVEAAWLAMVEAVPVERPETKTPGELAAAAVEAGLPAAPVERLTRAFRRVAYGGYRRTEDRTERALAAARRIRRALEGDR
ncbi:DUF4129 domain-containing protein [Halorientalis pallida]|uniref:DUF4129 domain-containing protein n=1 Tax=Halorientalis pallida TaxID=2479928 RepID=UPI003C6FCF02